MSLAKKEVGMRDTENLSLGTIEKQEAVDRKRSDQYTINRYLFAMLGKTEYVEAWWTRPNKNWNGQTPLSVYDRGREGQEEVFEYVLQCSYGGW